VIADCRLRIADWRRPRVCFSSTAFRNPQSALRNSSGSALIVALWSLIILGLLISAFAFDMHVEAGVTSFYRKRLKAQYLARAGVEYAKLMLDKSFKVKSETGAEDEDPDVYIQALNLQKGMGVSGLSRELGDGRFLLDILPEQGRRNVNTLSDEDWEEMLDQANVSQEDWPDLIDCFQDFTDPGDEHQLNGAESDDAFYEERGYECKNAPLDTVDELLLIKGFTPALVYGGPSDVEGEEPFIGIAKWLTTWGDGKVNVNTATKEVLLTIPGLEEYDVDDIINGRSGLDEEMGTKDDGYDSVDEVLAMIGLNNPDVAGRLTTTERTYCRVISKGEVSNVRSGIWCVLQVSEQGVVPLFWREEDMP
jgi:general secretion pathway protein K